MLLLKNYAKARGPSQWWSERLFQATSRNWLKKVLRMLNAWLMNAMPQKAWTKSRSTFMYPYVLKHFLKDFFRLLQFYSNVQLLTSCFHEKWFPNSIYFLTNYDKFYMFYSLLFFIGQKSNLFRKRNRKKFGIPQLLLEI